ncbi:MAG: hypothetical protein Q7U47_11105 [Paludibacter sp.]|nr:hypothetical protein [Paludibacter sp.]
MIAELIEGKGAHKIFAKASENVYCENKYFRGTNGSVEILVLSSHSAFNCHATVKKFVVRDGNDLVARFALIHDRWLPDYVQVSFFEAQKGLGDIFSLIKKEIQHHFPHCSKVVVGLNGHLNYGAGILMNRFNEPPIFGLPYNPDYYSGYFNELHCRKMATFRLSIEAYAKWAQSYSTLRELKGLTVRFMDKRNIKAESAIYTQLNNQAFPSHPFWANRDTEEDVELFYPFRHLLDNENLVFAEVFGKPVGFFLWYPDFNQLISSQRDLNVFDVLKYRLGKIPDTFRFTEIGIIPEFQRSPVALAMLNKALPKILEKGYKYCEGGFIFEENSASMAFVKGLLKRSFGVEPEIYRQYAVFETTL